jgi:hypothetical protein
MSDAHVILAGQSNALGFGNTSPAPYTPTARVQIWTDTNGDGTGDAWHYMQPGVNTGMPANPTAWGPETQFANDWLAHNPTGVLWIDKITKGSTGLAQDPTQLDWSPQSHGEMFDTATASVKAAMHNLDGTAYAFSHWDAALWMQGETDATDASKANAYTANLTGFLASARQAWSVTDFIVGRISDSPALAESLAVRQAEWNVDQSDAHMTSFKTIGNELQADGIHYDAAGQVQLGGQFFDAWAV